MYVPFAEYTNSGGWVGGGGLLQIVCVCCCRPPPTPTPNPPPPTKKTKNVFADFAAFTCAITQQQQTMGFKRKNNCF